MKFQSNEWDHYETLNQILWFYPKILFRYDTTFFEQKVREATYFCDLNL